MEPIEIINQNFFKEDESFTGMLREGKFDVGKFNEFMYNIYAMNHTQLNENKRLSLACTVWEISPGIMMSLACHYNKDDTFKIDNFDSELSTSLMNVLLLVPNQVTFNNKLSLEDIFI